MKTIVFSFIGKNVYEGTQYQFNGSEKIWKDSLIGNAIVNELNFRNVSLDKWIIIGTPTSRWSAIYGILDNENVLDKDIENLFFEVSKEQETGITDETLNKWQNMINENTKKVKDIHFYSIDPKDNSVYIDILLKELDVEESYNIVLDMTHGFRTMPIVMSFSIMLAQMLRKIEKINIYYGANDMKENGITPVLEIDFVNKLSNYTQGVSIYQNSGYFVPLLKEVGFSEEEGNELHHLLEMNRPLKKKVKKVIDYIGTLSDYQKDICLLLKKDLDEVIEIQKLHGRMIEKSKKLFAQKQYLKALILLYEGLIVCGKEKFYQNKPINKEEQIAIRKEIKKYLKEKGENELVNYLQIINDVRNAAVHGDNKQQQYLEDENKFSELYKQGIKLYERIRDI